MVSSFLPFQFTHPGRGATNGVDYRTSSLQKFQFTHPGRGATPGEAGFRGGIPSFNSRTPGGVRLVPPRFVLGDQVFQFTHPGRGATGRDYIVIARALVSIHAPREGCDASLGYVVLKDGFQFTHPGRGATDR